MNKKFNITGLCVPEKHYMVDTSNRINEIAKMVEDGEYFTINRPRQYGKTTTLNLLPCNHTALRRRTIPPRSPSLREE